ncbi:MAG: SpoIVB peptidase [Lachnospiraceae bacterium]|nr:SpoIVB peptidase [Lachnospiraceae bacterium]
MERNEIDCNGRLLLYRKILYISLILSVCLTFISAYYTLWNRVPSTIMVRAGMLETLDFNLPASGEMYREEAIEASGQAQTYGSLQERSVRIDFSNPVTVKANQVDNYKLSLKLFGIIPLKDVDVKIIQDVKLKPAGIPIGIYVKTQGVLVVGVGDFEGEQGQTHEPAKYVLQAGDYILEMNEEEVAGKKQLIEKISHSEGQEIVFKIKRDGEVFEVSATPQTNRNGEYKMGIWVRDNAQGVGTMTYIDENSCFGALGHGINDVDTSTLMELSNGTLYHTEIIGITKGQNGSPGELTGFIEYDDDNIMGTITANTVKGIFGVCSEDVTRSNGYDYMPIGLKQEIKQGPAQIISSLGGKAETFDVEITEIRLENDDINRGIVLEITDPDLLAVTGGIVQGMSGSPIIQDGKIIGAVTHVLVNDPTRGYGIFIENMLEH